MTTTFEIDEEVRDAVAEGRAVVALESTIISHGMPHPANVEMARGVEVVIRDHGAVPATIAVLDGVCRVGLRTDDLERLATATGVHKATTRDLPWLVATGQSGGTTVAATMHLAHRAGVSVFATGGIGGVHRGAASSFDISADLGELARTPVAVVSAGVKSILDIGLTLEYLETLGVPVVVDGSDEYPSFYSRRSGFPAPRRLDGPAAIATFLDTTWHDLGITTGVSVTTPIPATDEIPHDEMMTVIEAALADMAAQGVEGQAVTPFLLAAIVERTGGRSLSANVALVRHNAATAAAIAVELAARRRQRNRSRV